MSEVLIKGMEMPKPGAYTCELGVLDDNTAVLTIYTPIDEPQKGYKLVHVPPHGRLIDADAPIPLVDTHGKKIEVTVAHIIENNLGIVNAIIESEEEDDENI